jgi:glyoxylase I family protein
MPARLEHANLTVSDAQISAAQLSAIFDWTERWRGPSRDGGWTIHLGSATDYIALYQAGESAAPLAWEKGIPLNHIGIEVDDLDVVERRVVAQGLMPFAHGDYAPGRRFYFFDRDGIEFEVVSYR